MEDADKSMPSTHPEEEAVKKKYGGIIPKKPPLISKDHERAYFDSADWALGKILHGYSKVLRNQKDHWRLSGLSYSQLNSKLGTANLLVLHQKVKTEILPHQRMEPQVHENKLLILWPQRSREFMYAEINK